MGFQATVDQGAVGPGGRTLLLNVGHLVDHLFMLLFAKSAFDAGVAFGFGSERAYADMIPYGMPAAVLFGAGAPIAALLAERFSRQRMLIVFFVGIGLSAIAASFARGPIELAIALSGIGLFASIYHPVGIAMLVEAGGNIGWRLGVNGVWGNLGVAGAPLVAGLAIAALDWRLAFAGPGFFALAIGILMLVIRVQDRARRTSEESAVSPDRADAAFAPGWPRALSAVFLVASAGGFVFGAITFVIPRLFDVRLAQWSADPAMTGMLAAIVFAVASFSQIIVGRLLDTRSIRPILLTIGGAQVPLLFWMAQGQGVGLLVASVLAMGFVFSQVPIGDVVISRYVPDRLRPRVLSAKFVVNLSVGAMTLPLTSWILSRGDGFGGLFELLALVAILVVLAAMVLPAPPRQETESLPDAVRASSA